MNLEVEQCLDCKRIWKHEDDRCPECGSQNIDSFDLFVEFKALKILEEKANKKVEILTEGLTTIISLGSSSIGSREKFVVDIAVGTLNKANK